MHTITLSGFIGFFMFFLIVYLMIGYIVYRRVKKASPSRYDLPTKEKIMIVLMWWKHLT